MKHNFALKISLFCGMSCIVGLFFCSKVLAQPDTKDKVYKGLVLDEVMVKEVKKGFDVQSFIDKIKKDTTFYKAFKSLRLLSYNMYNDIQIEDKKGNVKASLNSITRQERKNNCRTMLVKSEQVKGDFYTKKHDYNYYTAKLYAHLFFTKGTICNENNIVGHKVYSGSQKYEEQLRILIFNPGQRIRGIPGIGDNVAIFEAPTVEKYAFKLSKRDYNGEPCYLFTAMPKKGQEKNVVINELTTWFRLSDYAIVARNYSLSFRTLFYDFDVVMKVKLKKVSTNLVPYEVNYSGNWHAVTKPREIVKFVAIFTDFE
ncbi:MAG TPA: hypothetical protein PKC41_09745 [Chitinophagaceae bacterium]|nr:hypothetical protein [Chitinophagaceae bacterium]